MSRKKTVKTSAKRTSAKSDNNIAAQIEKDFLNLPTQLAGHFNQATDALEQKAAKTKTAITKIDAQIQKLTLTLKAGKTKKTATAKKQAAAAKKALVVAKKHLRDLTKELAIITKSITALTLKAAKMQALKKHLVSFEKSWAKEAKALKKSAKAKASAKKTAAKAKPKKKASPVKAKRSSENTMPTQSTHDTMHDEKHFNSTEQANA